MPGPSIERQLILMDKFFVLELDRKCRVVMRLNRIANERKDAFEESKLLGRCYDMARPLMIAHAGYVAATDEAANLMKAGERS